MNRIQEIYNLEKNSLETGKKEEINWKVRVLLDCWNEHQFHHELMFWLEENIVWQDEAKKAVVDSIVWWILSFRDKKWPIWSLFFAWPTWVWKTEMVKALAKTLLWNENSYTRISCENYQESHTSRNLFWAPKSYLGYWDPTPLYHKSVTAHYDTAKKLWRINDIIRPLDGFSIILFDEIEKAHPNIHQSLLTLMDEWRIEFPDGSISRYDNVIIIFTSNIWEKEISNNGNKNPIWFNHLEETELDKSKTRNKQMKETFSPEFLWRLNRIIVFEKISKSEAIQIIDLHIWIINCSLNKYYHHSDISIKLWEWIYESILDKWFSKEKWARELIRFIDKEIENKLNILLNSEEFRDFSNLDTPVIINIEFENWNYKFYVEYFEDNKSEKKPKLKKSNNSFPISTNPLWNKPSLKIINEIYATISAYVEIYYLNMDWDVDFRIEVIDYEDKLMGYWFTNADILGMRNRAYIEAIDELDFITTFEWLNVFWWKQQNLFHPYRKKDIYKVVNSTVIENYISLWYDDLWIWLLKALIPRIDKLMKLKWTELKPEQIQELIIYMKKSIIENYW
jgi:MoxR-like ATPase